MSLLLLSLQLLSALSLVLLSQGLWCCFHLLMWTAYWPILQYFSKISFHQPTFFFSLHKSFQNFFCEILALKSCDKNNLHPCKDAALLYSPLDGFHGPHGLVFTQYSWNFLKKKKKNRFLHRSRYICLFVTADEQNIESLWFFLVLSKIIFASFVTIWVFEFCNNVCF